ncbi:hypothetical protein HD806DRAFT_494855 [Xylariaceae sp. AK1471]|nr:hypothetical protein HD806DRAFT_494855 [Xylariaceae sp. AK1471]
MFTLFIWTAWLLGVQVVLGQIFPPCLPFSNGTFTIDYYQLYPGTIDFGHNFCLLYISSFYNASVVLYDPYAASIVGTIEFPGITRTKPFRLGSVAWDPNLYDQKHTDDMSILITSAAAYDTAGRDVSGDNYLIHYDPRSGYIRWSVNLTATTQGRYGGLQDIEHDHQGFIYILGKYPGTLTRVSYDGIWVTEWYVPNRTTIHHARAGYTGLAADVDTLLVADARNYQASGGALYRFDMTTAKGKPTRVPIVPSSLHGETKAVIRPTDGIYLPAKYNNTVLLIAERTGISVLRSRMSGANKWRSAEFLGRIPNPPDIAASGAVVTAAVEIVGSVYLVEEWFTDPLVPGTLAGNRTLFPLIDITAQLEALVNPH